MSLVIRDGVLSEVASMDNRAARFGDGLFETMRWHRGQILFAEQHWQRLRAAARRLQLQLPDTIGPEQLNRYANRLAKALRADVHVRLRLTVCRAGGGAYLPETNSATWWLEGQPIPDFYRADVPAIKACLYRGLHKNFSAVSFFKNIGSTVYVLAALQAQRQGCDEAILINDNGYVVESSSANVFLVRRQTVITPPLTSGCIAGVLRGRLLAFLRGQRRPVQERPVGVRQLQEADELFLTNVIRGIIPVHTLQRKHYSHAYTRELAAAFYKTVPKA